MLSRPRLLTSMLTLPSGPPRLLHLGVGLDDPNSPHGAGIAGRQATRPHGWFGLQ